MIDENILIEAIKDHAKKVGGGISKGAIQDGYLLAHEHIIDIVRLISKSKKPKERCIEKPKIVADVIITDVNFLGKTYRIKTMLSVDAFITATYVFENNEYKPLVNYNALIDKKTAFDRHNSIVDDLINKGIIAGESNGH